MLDRQVGDAAPRVQLVRRGEGRGGAGVQAAPAVAATVLAGLVRRQVQRRVDLAQEQPGAVRPRHEVGVLALPAEPGPFRQRLLHDGGRVHEHLQLGLVGVGEPLAQRLQPALDQVVVVAVPRINRHDPAVGVGQQRARVVGGGVAGAERDDGARLRPQGLGVDAAVGLVLHPAHVAVPPLAQELRQPGLGLLAQFRFREADRVEAERQRPVADGLAEGKGISRAHGKAGPPAAGSTRPSAARRWRRTRRWGCRRAGTNSRRCAATPA